MSENLVSTPTRERCVTSYAARTQYKPGEIHPPHIKVKDAIDIHCHAHEGQQNPFDLAKRASEAEMKGILFKSIPGDELAKTVRAVQDDVNRWAEQERGELKPEICEIVRICADKGAALFFGHATHKEIYMIAEEVDKIGLKRAVIDHPFSPFLNLSPDQMKELSKIGILFNFTFDELSPLLGVDPQIMYNTIRAVGPEHFTLSSDAGEPLFPDSVEAMRLIRGYMEAFGL